MLFNYHYIYHNVYISIKNRINFTLVHNFTYISHSINSDYVILSFMDNSSRPLEKQSGSHYSKISVLERKEGRTNRETLNKREICKGQGPSHVKSDSETKKKTKRRKRE